MASWNARSWGIGAVPARRAGKRGCRRPRGAAVARPRALTAERRPPVRRPGAASVDYVLILAVILPLVLISIAMSRQIMGLAYEFLCVLVAWPFM